MPFQLIIKQRKDDPCVEYGGGSYHKNVENVGSDLRYCDAPVDSSSCTARYGYRVHQVEHHDPFVVEVDVLKEHRASGLDAEMLAESGGADAPVVADVVDDPKGVRVPEDRGLQADDPPVAVK